MRQKDIEAMTVIADDMTRALKEIADQIKILDGVVDSSPVRDKGQPMSFGQMTSLANTTAEMRRTIEYGLYRCVGEVERIIGQNMVASTEQEGS